MTDDTNRGAEWVTIGQAVRLTGKSRRTLWRMVDAKTLPINRDVRPFEVNIGVLSVPEDAPNRGMAHADDTVPLRAHVAHLEAQLGTAESDKAHLAELLAGANLRISELAGEVARLTGEAGKTATLVDRLTGEADYLRQALATAMALHQQAIEAPLDRDLRPAQPGCRWRWPWQREP